MNVLAGGESTSAAAKRFGVSDARNAAEHAEAHAGELNTLARQIAGVGIIPEQAIVGKPLLVRDYEISTDASNTVQIWHAVLLLPDGIGALVWDSEEYLDLPSDFEPSIAEARGRFIPFVGCPPVAKALLAGHTESLFGEVISLVEHRRRWLQSLYPE
ncbi:MAG TPA: hypothetical protein VFG04_28850 [Planctomycetaceae bacterium]|nr:hypothetical protein [Planctomycetaceae bacterium]